MAQAIGLGQPQEKRLPFAGRRRELENLTAALRQRSPRLILGPPGAGKTRLVEEALRAAGEPYVVAPRPERLHSLLVMLARQLGCRIPGIESLERAASVRLKPLILARLREAPVCVLVEDVAHADPRMYRFLQELYYVPRVCLVLTATSRSKLGFLHKLLWDPREEISLGPLSRADAGRLFEAAADEFGLRALDLDEFRGKVLAAARGNPGQIVSMCRLAGRAEYQSGRHIQFLPIRIDVLSSMAYE